jgi:catechol 2,3-dioxygenase-like lactoylglutathione lyase family enzyme
MAINFKQTIPLLRIFDVQKAKEFYVEFLGFKVDWEHHFDENSPAYLQVSRNGLVLHLSEHHGDGSPGSSVFVWMTGIDDFHQEIISKGYRYLRPSVETTFYDAKCMEVIDPFNNRIRFNENLKEAKAP